MGEIDVACPKCREKVLEFDAPGNLDRYATCTRCRHRFKPTEAIRTIAADKARDALKKTGLKFTR